MKNSMINTDKILDWINENNEKVTVDGLHFQDGGECKYEQNIIDVDDFILWIKEQGE